MSSKSELAARYEPERVPGLQVPSTSACIIDPPPPFTNDSAVLIDDFPPSSVLVSSPTNESEPPPEFSPYQADYFEKGNGDVVSHDPHLNTDGEALHRFLLGQANDPPSLRLHCRGTHPEHRTRWVTANTNGRDDSESESRETYTETAIDFDFCIEISLGPAAGPVHWSVADFEPAYRGLMTLEVEESTGKRAANHAERKARVRESEQRRARGLPPWITNMDRWSEGIRDDIRPLRSSKTLRQWADEYCASRKYLKEFVYKKIPYGWDLQKLESTVRSSISASRYWGSIEVDFRTYGSNIYIRPDNRLSRILSNKWLKFLSILLLIYPFIWLFKRFHSRGGGRWEVCGGAYALQRWESVDGRQTRSDGLPPAVIGLGFSSRLMQMPQGVVRLIGTREEEWLREWEETIIQAVLGNYRSSTPILAVDSVSHSFLRGIEGL